MIETAGEALKALEETLNATSVLSDNYKRHILGWAYKATELAHRAGMESGAERIKALEDRITAIEAER